MYTEGTHVLYPDVPEFVPTFDRPENHRYVGICDWTPPVAKPAWWDRMTSDPNPKVFVSLGSSGPLQVFPALLRALSRLPVSVVISTSGRHVPTSAGSGYTADLLPFTDTASESSLVVSHGGSGGLYPAMAAGTPVMASDLDAFRRVLDDGRAGRLFGVGEPAQLAAGLAELLGDAAARATLAGRGRVVVAGYDWPVIAESIVDIYRMVTAGAGPVSLASAADA